MAQYKKEIHLMLIRAIEQGLNQVSERKKSTILMGFDEWLIMEHIHHNQQTPVTKLMDDMPLDRGIIHSALQKMLKLKWVVKHQMNEDKRMVFMRLTDKGIQLMEHEREVFESGLAYLLKDLTVNEEKGVLKFLSKLHQYIKH